MLISTWPGCMTRRTKQLFLSSSGRTTMPGTEIQEQPGHLGPRLMARWEQKPGRSSGPTWEHTPHNRLPHHRTIKTCCTEQVAATSSQEAAQRLWKGPRSMAVAKFVTLGGILQGIGGIPRNSKARRGRRV